MAHGFAHLSKMDANLQCQRVGHDRQQNLSIHVDQFSRLERAKAMRLYQHAARCPSALRTFLDGNPQYWCFIPRPENQAMLYHFNSFGEPRERPSELDHLVRNGVIEDRRLVDYLEHVPLPPTGFVFSYQDRQQQRFFFKQLLSMGDEQLPFISLDLYKVAVIAVRK